MATGVPSRNGNGNGGALELTYPGKAARAQILAEPARASFQAVHELHSRNRLYCGDNLAVLKTLYNDPALPGKSRLSTLIHRLPRAVRFSHANR